MPNTKIHAKIQIGFIITWPVWLMLADIYQLNCTKGCWVFGDRPTLGIIAVASCGKVMSSVMSGCPFTRVEGMGSCVTIMHDALDLWGHVHTTYVQQTFSCHSTWKYMALLRKLCKMWFPHNFVFEILKYLWFYPIFWILILNGGLKLPKLLIVTFDCFIKWLTIH